MVLHGPDSEAGDGKHEEEDYDDYRNGDVALDHFEWRGPGGSRGFKSRGGGEIAPERFGTRSRRCVFVVYNRQKLKVS